MTGDLQQAPELVAEPTEARFTVRALLVVMVIVAIASALVGPIVRSVQPDTQFRLLVTWSIWLVASVAWISYLAHQRRAAEKLAGRAILRVAMFDERLANVGPVRRKLNVVLTALTAIFLISVVSVMVADLPASWRSLDAQFVFMAMASVWWTSRVATSLWWRTNVRFGEHGVLWDRRVMLWDHIASSTWDVNGANILEINGIDQKNRDIHLKVLAPAANRATLRQLLDSKAEQKPNVAIQSPMNELGLIQLSVAARDPRFVLFLGRIVLFFIVFLTVPALFGNGFTGVREFDPVHRARIFLRRDR